MSVCQCHKSFSTILKHAHRLVFSETKEKAAKTAPFKSTKNKRKQAKLENSRLELRDLSMDCLLDDVINVIFLRCDHGFLIL